ncbi:hypothetical protein Ae201684P_020900 [Aphanomyces euteiches]|nr:hypothetical protein Ae201684P_020900 [Aphanomyces euteiches]
MSSTDLPMCQNVALVALQSLELGKKPPFNWPFILFHEENGALVFFLSVPQHRKSQRDLLLAILSITHSYKMQQEGESTKLCANGCGFFGSAASGGMCSVCWKKTMSNRQVETQSYTSTPVAAPVVEAAAAPSVDVDAPTPAEATPVEAPVVQKNKSRCWECKKKVGLTGIECRCGFVYCGSHRFADQHNCSYDFKSADRAELAKRNPGGGASIRTRTSVVDKAGVSRRTLAARSLPIVPQEIALGSKA